MPINTRRGFLTSSGKLIDGTAALAAMGAHAAEEHAPHGESGDGHAMDAGSENMCATCQFWGGMRKISEDGKQVVAQSMGWCNNPESPNHRKLTAPDHEMKKAGIWKKWAAL